MLLEELDAEFIRLKSEEPLVFNHIGVRRLNAQGVIFNCPKCKDHKIIAWFNGVPKDINPGPARYMPVGHIIDNLSLTPSISISCWHGSITNGIIKD